MYSDLVYKFNIIARKLSFSDQFNWIKHGCCATVCMPGYKPNHIIKARAIT